MGGYFAFQSPFRCDELVLYGIRELAKPTSWKYFSSIKLSTNESTISTLPTNGSAPLWSLSPPRYGKLFLKWTPLYQLFDNLYKLYSDSRTEGWEVEGELNCKSIPKQNKSPGICLFLEFKMLELDSDKSFPICLWDIVDCLVIILSPFSNGE